MKQFAIHKHHYILLGLAIVIFICFHYTLGNQFTNWDDDFYVTNDPYIKGLNWENLKVIFTKDITKNNYHPLCMLSLALNYQFSQLNPMGYYLTNILIHIINALLLFHFVVQLAKQLKLAESSGLFMGLLCGLWFGIHPMHVESVAWIAERKDVLYALFYIWGMTTYLKFMDGKGQKWFWITFILFVASILSKPMAVVFPLSLLCLDFLLGRKVSLKLGLEKWAFFATSLLFGGMAYYTQHKTGAIADFGVLTLQERVMYASYGYIQYLQKLFNPTYLSTFYPYPFRYTTGYLPNIYYAAPLLAVGLNVGLLYLCYKRSQTWFRFMVFGLGFFLANLIFVLQFISCGAAIMADRYSYVAYIGLLIVLTYGIDQIRLRWQSYQQALYLGVIAASLTLGYLCYERTKVWHDAESLLSDAIKKYPYRAFLSYKWLGNFYLDKAFATADTNFANLAIDNYLILTNLRSADGRVWRNLGKAFSLKQDYEQANIAFEQAIKMGVPDVQLIPQPTTQIANAMNPDSTAKVDSNTLKAIAELAFNHVQTGKFEAAITEYNALIRMQKEQPLHYFYRGVAYFSLNQMKPAISDWEYSLKYNNKDVLKSATYNLSVAYDSIGEHQKAYKSVLDAKRLGWDVQPDFELKLKKRALQ